MYDDEDENQKQERGIFSRLRQGYKKFNRSKFKMLLKALMSSPIAVKILLLIVAMAGITVILGAVIHIIDTEGSSSTSDVATDNIIDDMTGIVEDPDGGGYYFSIGKDAKEKYLEELNRAFYEGYYYEDNVDNPDDTGFVYDPDNAQLDDDYVADWFGTKDYEKYLIKMLRAEMASSYPKLRRLLWRKWNR